MSQSSLVLHAGGTLCSYDELKRIPAPPPEGRWHPISHVRVLDTVSDTLTAAGYEIRDRKLAVARDGRRFFGTLDLSAPLACGVSLAVGVRNSIDKSFPLGFCAGSRVFICDNLAFRAELLVKRKHTRFGERRFNNQIAAAVQSLASFQEAERLRVKRMMETDLTEDRCYALILRAFERAIIASTVIGKVLSAWKHDDTDYGTGDRPTVWRLLNCFTTVLRGRAVRSPAEYAGQTIRLNALLAPEAPGVVHAA